MIKAVLLDLDGTVYEGTRLIPGADEAVDIMRDMGLKVIFCTNNSSRPRSKIASKLRGMGIPCEEGDVVSSGFMAMEYAREHGLRKVYLCGSNELRMEFIENGIDICDAESCENLIIGMDSTYDYEKMTLGVRAALRAERIIICNRDRLYPAEDGLRPGSGAIVSSILSAAGRTEDVILGKPCTAMMEYVSRTISLSADEMLVIGDSAESDGAMASAYGSGSALVGNDLSLLEIARTSLRRISEKTDS